MIWAARHRDGRELVIECNNLGDAHATALRLLKVIVREDILVSPAFTAVPQLELRWMPGPPGMMHPEVRERVADAWGPWTDERDFTLQATP